MLPTYSLNYMQVFIVAEYADDYFQTMYEQELWIIIYWCFIYSPKFPNDTVSILWQTAQFLYFWSWLIWH